MAGETATGQGQTLYLVGGIVRDLFLGRPNLDLDLVVEGDALKLANELAQRTGGEMLSHPRFGTAKFHCRGLSIDLATARTETYAKPGSLPTVKPGLISDDLIRRDFSINAMAIHLDPEHYGNLIDPYGGRKDIEHHLIRILHPNSFIDDPTRSLRALRYQQRLGFQLEQNTSELLQRDAPILEQVSGDRIRHELELILKEDRPERVLRRAGELKVLQQLHPSLKGNGWLEEKFEQARRSSQRPTPAALYLSLLIYHLSEEESESLISRLKMTKGRTQTMRDTLRLKAELHTLADPCLPNKGIYRLLRGYAPQAILANSIASDSPIIRHRLRLFLTELRYVKSSLDGDALKKLGVPTGPKLGQILEALRDARLDGEAKTREDEKLLVHRWLININ